LEINNKRYERTKDIYVQQPGRCPRISNCFFIIKAFTILFSMVCFFVAIYFLIFGAPIYYYLSKSGRLSKSGLAVGGLIASTPMFIFCLISGEIEWVVATIVAGLLATGLIILRLADKHQT